MRNLMYLPGILLILVPLIGMMIASGRRERAEREAREAQAAQAAERKARAERQQAIAQARAEERQRKQAERQQAAEAREAERQRKQAERLEAARQRAEYAERELQAKRAMKALERGEDAERGTAPEPSEPAPEPAPEPALAPALPKINGNNAFKGHVVAFTGRLPGMTRARAIEAVRANGGRAYTKMPAGTTLLVVGDKPGMRKMDKADEWIGQVRKITAAQFFEMLDKPLEIEMDELAALLAAKYAA